MDLQLNPVEVRVLGSLMEKDAATPDYYPLSLNALLAACNQKSNREPVMSLDESTLLAAVESLCMRGLALDISGGEHRVHKYGHRLGEVFNFDRREQAVMGVLMLRGPQTVGELRGRTERLYTFDDLASVEATLNHLAERTPPLVTKLARRPGEKESRFAHLLSGVPEPPEQDVAAYSPRVVSSTSDERVLRLETQTERLETEIARLETELADLRRQFEEFRRKFE
jgi:uncharacterized protein YceH (UPF0502 family)